MSKTITMNVHRWDKLEWDGKRPSEVIVRLTPVWIDANGVERAGYAWSPDGYGAYYYDSLDEARANHD
jgi:hypothetical protein